MKTIDNKILIYSQADFEKAVESLEYNLKDGIRECNIYNDTYNAYLKKGGVITEDIKIFNDRVEFILNELYNFKSKVFDEVA